MGNSPDKHEWLLLIHQIPPKPSYFRVKVWRRLLALGAIPIKNSVYVLPNADDARALAMASAGRAIRPSKWAAFSCSKISSRL